MTIESVSQSAQWLSYCLGDEFRPFRKVFAFNVHRAMSSLVKHCLERVSFADSISF